MSGDRALFYILDAEHHLVAVDVEEWGKWFENISNRCVGYTEITSEVCVSTIFIGMDHRLLGDGPPIVFETLVMGGPLDGDGQRYSSWDDAEIGHRTYVRKTRAAMGQKVTEDNT